MWIDGTTMYVLISCKSESLKAVVVETYWIGTTTKLKVCVLFMNVFMQCMPAFDICGLTLSDYYVLVHWPGQAISSSSHLLCLCAGQLGWGRAGEGSSVSYPDHHTELDKRVICVRVSQLSIKPPSSWRKGHRPGDKARWHDMVLHASPFQLELLYSSSDAHTMWESSIWRSVTGEDHAWRSIPCTNQIMLPYLH